MLTWTEDELFRWCLSVPDSAALFEHIDTFSLSCNFLVIRMEDDREVDRGIYEKQGGQIVPIQKPEKGPLDHLMEEIQYSLNQESAVDALWRRWSRQLVAERRSFEQLIKDLEVTVDIVHDPDFMAASGLEKAFWLKEVADTEGPIQWRQGKQLAYERGRYALFSVNPRHILQEYREQAEHQFQQQKSRYLHGLAWGYRTLLEEAHERRL